jgi:hypothetical protein
MQPALEAALAELVLGPKLDPRDAGQVRAWLERHQIPAGDQQAILDTELERLLVYRELVQSTLKGALLRAIPRSMARLGSVFDEYFARFLNERGPKTHYLRDVAGELLDYMSERVGSDARVPDYWLDLARHEALHIEIAATPVRAQRAPAAALDLESGLGFSESVRLMRYAFAVHTLDDDPASRSEPSRTKTDILAYRDREHDVRYLELTPFATAILQRLLAGNSLKYSLIAAADELQVSLDDATLSATAALLADLAERGVVTVPIAATRDSSDHDPDRATLAAEVTPPHPPSTKHD